MPWPPQLRDVKLAMGADAPGARDDVQLQLCLDAAVAYVERERVGDFNFTGDPASTLPAPSQDLHFGTVRYAIRQHKRASSPDGLVVLGADLGSSTIPSTDPDIDRMLGIGRYRPPMV